jgi:hypothetical protein
MGVPRYNFGKESQRPPRHDLKALQEQSAGLDGSTDMERHDKWTPDSMPNSYSLTRERRGQGPRSSPNTKIETNNS